MLIEPRDFALARNNAAPALASSEAASAPLCGNTEMPVVTPVRTDLPSIRNSFASASASCSASSMPATGCLPSMINPNSSPESRATTPPRAEAWIRRATSISSLSPIAWPNTSLISFRPSRSTDSTANSSSVPSQASIICASACRNAARFGRSVRPS